MQVWSVLHAACRTPSHNFVGLYLRNVSTIGKKLVKMCTQYGDLWPTSGWNRSGSFNWFRVSAPLLHGTLVVDVGQTLRRWTEGAIYIRQGGHHVGHRPTFLVVIITQLTHYTVQRRVDAKTTTTLVWTTCLLATVELRSLLLGKFVKLPLSGEYIRRSLLTISRKKCGESLWAIRSSSDGMNEDRVLRSSEIQNKVIFTNLKVDHVALRSQPALTI